MTYHDASTRFGDRAHFPSMGSQLPKHIPGRRGVFVGGKPGQALQKLPISRQINFKIPKSGHGAVEDEEFFWRKSLACFLLPKDWLVNKDTLSSQRYTLLQIQCIPHRLALLSR